MSSCETSDAEGPVPVNSAAILKKSQPAASSSPCRGHVLRKAKVSPAPPRVEVQAARPFSRFRLLWEGWGSCAVFPFQSGQPAVRCISGLFTKLFPQQMLL